MRPAVVLTVLGLSLAVAAPTTWALTRPGTTTAPPARTSTAGAAAVCRTVTRAWPAGTAETSLTNGVSAGWPSAVRWATTVALAPAGTATPFADRSGVPDPSAASAGNRARS